MQKENKPNYWWSILTFKCPRCRRGNMFSNKNAWNLRQTLKMPEKCPECGQPFVLEVGFWYGTGYVSYALTFIMSVVSFLAWWLFIGISTEDNRFFWWMGLNAAMLILLQPWIMRLSRVVYLYFFVRYDENYKQSQVKAFDYQTKDYYEEEKPVN
jgi:transposase-like protein